MMKYRSCFFIAVLFLFISCGSEYSAEVYESNFNVPPADVTSLSQNVVSNSQVLLSWMLPEDSSVTKVRVSSSVKGETAYMTEIIDKRESYSIYGLDSGKNYVFTVQTVNKNGTFSSGVSIEFTPNINTDLITYKLKYKTLDFGYVSDSAEKSFLYTSELDEDISLEDISIAYVEGEENVFSFVKSDAVLLKPGETACITVRYEPSSSESWDEADLVLNEESGVSIRLIGSGYPQPSDVQASHLTLWLRADLVASSDFDTYDKVIRMPDYSSSGCDATAFNSEVPSYVILASMKNQPVLYFKNYERLTAQGQFANNVDDGTTTFIVAQKGTSLNSSFYYTAANGYNLSFPSFGTYSRNFDVLTGCKSSSSYVHMISGNGYAGTYRFLFDDSEDDDNCVKIASSGIPFTLCAVADFKSTGISNSFAWLNGEKQLVSFTSSNNLSTLTETSLGYAYGKPWSDGEGHLYKSLWNMEESTDAEREAYYKYSENLSTHPSRPNDAAIRWWGLKSGSNYFDLYGNEYGAAKINTDYTNYFVNTLSTTRGICNTISNVYLGTRIDTTTTPGDAYIACVMVYDTVLTAEEIDTVNNYIYYRYGVGSEL
ncbi:MAG: fibronectin type III domain-containing protein [Treponema sp.]|nr:fibronectin type III domain-containing protein [Treponema sp.]